MNFCIRITLCRCNNIHKMITLLAFLVKLNLSLALKRQSHKNSLILINFDNKNPHQKAKEGQRDSFPNWSQLNNFAPRGWQETVRGVEVLMRRNEFVNTVPNKWSALPEAGFLTFTSGGESAPSARHPQRRARSPKSVQTPPSNNETRPTFTKCECLRYRLHIGWCW